MYKNVGFVGEVKRFFKIFFVHFFSLKREGGEVFHFSNLHNFYVQDQIFLEIIDLDSSRRDLSIDMLHDIIFPTRF